MATLIEDRPGLATEVAAPDATACATTVLAAQARVVPVSDERHTAWRAARAHRWIARALLAGLTLQLFFAGLGVFGITTFVPHIVLGSALVATSFALPIVAWRGRLELSVVRRSWALVGLMLLQGLLIDVGRLVPVVAAAHPVNAMLLVLVTYSLARRTI